MDDKFLDVHEKVGDGYYDIVPEEYNPKLYHIQDAFKEAELEIKKTFVGTFYEIEDAIKEAKERIKKERNEKSKLRAKRLEELQAEFKKDVFHFYDVTDNPKAEVLFAIVHSRNGNDRHILLEEFEAFVDLVKD